MKSLKLFFCGLLISLPFVRTMQSGDIGIYTPEEERKEQAEQDRQLALALQEAGQEGSAAEQELKEKDALKKGMPTINTTAEALALWFHEHRNDLLFEPKLAKMIKGFAPATWPQFGNESKVLYSFSSPERFGCQIACSQDGQYLAVMQEDGVRVWNMQHQEAGFKFIHNPKDGIGSSFEMIYFSPDSHYLVFISQDGIRVWEPESSENVLTKILDGVTGEKGFLGVDLRLFVFSPGGDYIVTSAGNELELGVLENKEFVLKKILGSHERRIRQIVFSPDGRYLASRGSGQSFKIWDMKSQKKVKTLLGTWDARQGAFSQDARYFFSLGGNVLTVWKIGELGLGKKSRILGRSVNRGPGSSDVEHFDEIYFSRNGRYVGVITTNRLEIMLWDTKGISIDQPDENMQIISLPAVSAADDKIFGMVFSGDGSQLAVLSFKKILLYDLRDPLSQRPIIIELLDGDNSKSVIFSPDGSYLAAASSKKIRIFDLLKMRTRMKKEQESDQRSREFQERGQLRAEEGESTSDWFKRFNKYSIEYAIPKE